MRREDHWRLPHWPTYSPQNRRAVAVPLLISGHRRGSGGTATLPAPVHRVTAPGTRRPEPADRDPVEVTRMAAVGGELAVAQELGLAWLADEPARLRALLLDFLGHVRSLGRARRPGCSGRPPTTPLPARPSAAPVSGWPLTDLPCTSGGPGTDLAGRHR